MVQQVHTHHNTSEFGTEVRECLCPNPDAKLPSWHNPGHTHTTPDGLVIRCYHTCKSVLASPAFWIGSTLSFPIEHALWTKIPFLQGIATWAGL